jgi:hypothetical protein
MVSIIELVIYLSLVVIFPVFFLFLSTWMHELSHLLFIVILGCKPVAILCSKKGVALAVVRESIKNRKHETIVAVTGLLGGLLAAMLFSLILTLEFGFWHVGFLVLILGLINAVYSSKFDFKYLLLIHKYSVREREKRQLEDMKKFAEGRGFFSWGMAIILSRKRWTSWKKKEGILGVKINVREIALN